MAFISKRQREGVREEVTRLLEEKLRGVNDSQSYSRLATDVVDGVLASIECEEPEQEMWKGKLSRILPLVKPLMAALTACLCAWLGSPVLTFFGVCLVYLGAELIKAERNMNRTKDAPKYLSAISLTELQRQLEKIEFLQPETHQQTQHPQNLLTDEGFHRWLQQFAVKVHRRGDYNDRQILLSLKDTLENFGLYIYDELEDDGDGNIVLPPLEDAFMDMREGEEWTAVTLPAVYTREKVLLCGVIK